MVPGRCGRRVALPGRPRGDRGWTLGSSGRHRDVALLIPEPANRYDPHAVAVWIDGKIVGYLSRDNAEVLQPAIMRLHQRHGRPVACRARIVGGWDRGAGDRGHFGVRLYLDPADFGRRSGGPRRGLGGTEGPHGTVARARPNERSRRGRRAALHHVRGGGGGVSAARATMRKRNGLSFGWWTPSRRRLGPRDGVSPLGTSSSWPSSTGSTGTTRPRLPSWSGMPRCRMHPEPLHSNSSSASRKPGPCATGLAEPKVGQRHGHAPGRTVAAPSGCRTGHGPLGSPTVSVTDR